MADLSVEQILSGSVLGLSSGLDDLFVLSVGGRDVLYALNRAENRLFEVEIGASGALTLIGALGLGGTFAAGSDPLLGVATTANGDRFLMLAGLPPGDGQGVSLSNSGALETQETVAGLGQLVAPVGVEVGAVSVIVSGASGGGLTHYADTGGGYVHTGGLSDTADRYLGDVAASVVFADGGAVYVATVSATENGVNVALVGAGWLSQAGALGNADGLSVTQPGDIASFTRLGETMLAVASFGTSSVSIVRVEGGVPYLADHVLDGADTRFAGASTIAAITHGDFAYLAVGGAEGGVTLMTVLPGGRLIHLSSVAENETAPLDQISALEMHVAGGALQIFTGSSNEAGLARLEYDLSGLGVVAVASGDGQGAGGTALDDQVIGSDVSESLNGFAGDDILLDGAGNDVLNGGAGSDLFVFTADGVWDRVEDFERGVDKLDFSAFDFLYDVSQLTITPTATGAILSFGSETIIIDAADNAPLSAADFTNADILNVDRPPYLLIGREIVGNSADEILNGGPGNDTIAGAGGHDSLTGGPGRDVLLGSTGDDTLIGAADADTLVGGVGNDLLDGGYGDDVIYGDDWL